MAGGPKRRPVEDRFWEKVDRDGPTPEHAPNLGPCWLWTGRTDRLGYAQFKVDGRNRLGHRWAYLHFIGDPNGLELDHLCNRRNCVNFERHLQPATHRENTLRGGAVSAVAAAATHCPSGHPYDPSNTTIGSQGDRRCKTCRSETNRRYRERRRQRQGV